MGCSFHRATASAASAIVPANSQEVARNIRALQPGDLPAIKAIDRVSFSSADRYEDAFYETLAYDRNLMTLVATDFKGRVLGYVLIDLIARPIRLRSVAVHPEHRRRGFGEALVLHALKEAGGPLELLVDGANANAVRLYERLGFSFVENTTEMPSKKAMRSPP